jgi:sulfate transport system substrate-binding protein
MKARTLGLALTAVAALTGVAACGGGGSASSSSGGKSVDIVAYSTPAKAYAKLIPAFQQTTAGKGTTFGQSYGPSGSQARQVVAGQHADVVEFSAQPDMDSLVQQQLVAPTWSQNPYHGFVTESVAVIVVRKGNPLHINGWDDLARPGIKVVTPNPETSGSARWNIMALYGSQITEGKTPAQALAFVSKVLHNTVSQPASGSDALATFTSGTGDVLISYENEAIAAQQAGADISFIRPPNTILIQNPIAVTTDASDPTLARNFVQFLYSDKGQKIFASEGYRPVVKRDFDAKQFPVPKQLFTIQKFGGWTKVVSQFFDPTNGSITKIENSLGTGSGG